MNYFARELKKRGKLPLSKPIQFYLSSSFFFRPPSKPKILIPARSDPIAAIKLLS